MTSYRKQIRRLLRNLENKYRAINNSSNSENDKATARKLTRADDETRASMLLDETVLMYSSVKGVSKARSAFDELESKLPSLRGRKFFGYYNPDTDEYRACVAVVDGDPKPETVGLVEWRITRGRYVYEKISDWNRNIKLIGPTFERMIQENHGIIDWSRPLLEFYKSRDELRLLVPVTG